MGNAYIRKLRHLCQCKIVLVVIMNEIACRFNDLFEFLFISFRVKKPGFRQFAQMLSNFRIRNPAKVRHQGMLRFDDGQQGADL
ncbi:hypothetical protein D3C85_1482390 [compost metagenome]